MNAWAFEKLGEVSKIKGRIGWKGYKTSDLRDSGPIVFSGTEVKSNSTMDFSKVKHLTPEKFEESPEIILKDKDIMLATRGSLGQVGFYRKEYGPATINPSLVIISEFAGVPEFLFYYLISKAGQENVLSKASGTTIPAIYQSDIKQILIPYPPEKTQRDIAEILSSLDDKIELNNQINRELEALAQALFKHWFIDFEFPISAAEAATMGKPKLEGKPYKSFGGKMVESELGEIPKGWSILRLSDLIEITGGGTPKRSNPEYWNGTILWFSIQDITNSLVFDTVEKITRLGLENSSTKLLPKGTTIITARGTVGKLAFIAEPMAMNQSCYGINGKGIGVYFNYFNLKQAVNTLRQNTHGAVFDTITTTTFDTVEVAFGNIALTSKFNAVAKEMFDQMEVNVRENGDLSMLRDTLLPKLISGELEVGNHK